MTSEDAQAIIQGHATNRPDLALAGDWALEHWPVGGTNPKRLLKDPIGNRWVLKLCTNSIGRTPEICEREELISLLGKVAQVPIVDAWVCPAASVLCHFGQIIDPQIICDKIVVMPLLPGHTVQAAREATAVRIAWNPEKASDLFAFMLWVGDEDRGLDDGMLVGDQIVLIDNGLCGPGAGLSLRSYHPYPEHYQYENRVKMCYGGKQSFVAYVLRDMRFPSEMLISPSAIARIEKISDDVIREVVVIVGLPTQICDKLIERKRALLDDYRTWLAQASDVCKPHSS